MPTPGFYGAFGAASFAALSVTCAMLTVAAIVCGVGWSRAVREERSAKRKTAAAERKAAIAERDKRALADEYDAAKEEQEVLEFAIRQLLEERDSYARERSATVN